MRPRFNASRCALSRRYRRLCLLVPALVLAAGAAPALAAPITFNTPGEHVYTVPPGVTQLAVTAVGGSGAGSAQGGAENRAAIGGRGAIVHSVITVTPGQLLYAEIGSNAVGRQPGANGGGAVADSTACPQAPGAGGGASDVRTLSLSDPGTVASRLVVAGGGGGAGTPGSSGMAGDGGDRGDGGYNGQDSSGETVGPVPGGMAGEAGQPGTGSGARGGTTDTGGTGQASTSPSFGCGGGGGGGGGGGAGGTAATTNIGGGAGGGGGSLDPDGGARGGQPAPAGTAPSVTLGEAPSTAATLHVTSNLFFDQFSDENCPPSCMFCDVATPSFSPPLGDTQCADRAAAANSVDDAGWFSEEHWGSAQLKQHGRVQAGAGLDPPGPDLPVELGVPFPLADFIHWNISIRGDSPTAFGIAGDLTVQPPAGDPVNVPLEPSHSDLFLNLVTTVNTPTVAGCDPSIQVTSTPCDDLWTLGYPGSGDLTPPPTVVRGVTWHLQILGYDDLHGGFTRNLIAEGPSGTELEKDTEREIYAELTVDTNPTTTTVDSGSTLTAQVSPTPSTGGTVAFLDGGNSIAGCEAVPVDTSTGAAQCSAALGLGSHTVTAHFSGGVGFAASTSDPLTVTRVDSTPPTTTLTLSPAAPSGAGGWYGGPVSVGVSGADDLGGSGLAATRCAVDPATPPASYDDLPPGPCGPGLRVTGDGAHRVYAASVDSAGNKETPVSVAFKIDTTAPTLAPTVPALTLGQRTASAAPHATDGGSGVASESCGALDTTKAGDHAVRCTATDVAGNTKAVDVHYLVAYRVRFLSPRSGSKAKRGKTVSVRIALTDAAGKRISDKQAAALVRRSSCRVRISASRASKCMKYRAKTNDFVYSWKLPKRGRPGAVTIAVRVTYAHTSARTVTRRRIRIAGL